MDYKHIWIVFSGVASSAICFLLGTFPLRLFFALSFFLISILLYIHLVRSENEKTPFGVNLGKYLSKMINIIPYLLGVAASLVFFLSSSIDIQIVNTSVGATFSSLSLFSLIKVFLGFYFIGFFPGYITVRSVLRRFDLSFFEKLGLILAVSYSVSSLIGLILSYFSSLTSLCFVVSIWLLVLGLSFVGANKDESNVIISKINLHETSLLLVISFSLLLGSYALTLSVGPLSGITSGDIGSYMGMSNELFNMQLTQNYPALFSYMKVQNILTGLPLIYVYSGIQYLVLIIPCSVYFFMKVLFRKHDKAAAVSALLVSLFYGMSSLPFFADLAGDSSMYNQYMMGDTNAAMTSFTNIFYANTQSSVLWSRTVEFGLFFFAMALIFSYLVKYKERNLTALFFGILFLNMALFSRGLFMTLVAVGCVMLFTLIYDVPKKKILNTAVLGVFFFVVFNAFAYSKVVDLTFTLPYIYSTYRMPNAGTGLSNQFLFIGIAFSVYLFLLFGKKLFAIRSWLKRPQFLRNKSDSVGSSRLNSTLWIFGFLIVAISLVLCVVYYDSLRFVSMNTLQPWYVWVVYWGFQIPLIVGGFRYLLKNNNTTAMYYLGSLALVVVVLSLLFGLGSSITSMDSGLGTHYLFFMSFPLSCLASLVLIKLFPLKLSVNVTQSLNKNFLKNLTLRENKVIGYLILSFLIISISSSFLSYSISVARYCPSFDSVSAVSSSDTEVLQWIYDNITLDSTIVALSEKSYRELCSIFSGTVFPIFLSGESYSGGTWPRNIIVAAQSPETVLYALNQMGANYIFVSSEDSNMLFESNTVFASLIKWFPITFVFGESKLYSTTCLYEGSNYHLVSGMWNFPATHYTIDYSKESNPSIICDDDQTNFWNVYPLDEGAGQIGPPMLAEDLYEKQNGSDSLKITIGSGTYARWQIYHEYTSPQNWTGNDYVSLFWYGTNTGNILSLEFQGLGRPYPYIRYDIKNDWTGWKRIVIPLSDASAIRGRVDDVLANVTRIAIGFWRSSNVAGTFYLDRVVVDVGFLEEEIIKEQPNSLQATELLLNARIPYDSVSENDLKSLLPNQVYLFPCNSRINDVLLENLKDDLNNGAHTIFFDPVFASYNGLNEQKDTQLSILNITSTLKTFAPTINQIVFNRTSIECETPLFADVSFGKLENLATIAQYELATGAFSPFIVQEKVGEGSITFVDLATIKDLPYDTKIEVYAQIIDYLLDTLPAPNVALTPQSSVIPSIFLSSLAFRGSNYNLWHNKDLQNKLLFSSDIKLNGSITVLSDQIYLSYPQLFITELQIISNEGVKILKNNLLSDVQIIGSGGVSFNESQILFYNYPGGLYDLMTGNVSTGFEHSLDIENAQIKFVDSNLNGEQEQYSLCNITLITNDSFSFNLRVKQPEIIVNGAVGGKIFGGIIHDEYFFYDRGLDEYLLLGNFRLNILYSSGNIVTEVRGISSFSWRRIG